MMKKRHKIVLTFLGAVILVSVATLAPRLYVAVWLPDAAWFPAWKQILYDEDNQRKVDQQKELWRKQERKFTPADAQKQLQVIRQEMLQTGTSTKEVDKVLMAYQNTGIDGYWKPGVYIWPIYAKRAIVKGRPVWVFKSAWEYNRITKGLNSPPGHVWEVAILGQWPYAVLASNRCG